MSWTTDPVVEDGVSEREFTLDGAGGPIPGVRWAPAEGRVERRLLLGHGGTADKRADYIVGVAKLAAAKGFESVAIDGPGHGDRVEPARRPTSETFFQRWDEAGGTESIVADWRQTLDFLEADGGARPTGWWGLSMGTMVGLPVCAGDDRISIAVLGLMGRWGPNADDLVRLAPTLRCPLRFLVQWDDEVVPRDRCLELFGLLGSERKTLHANPGAHAAVPIGEVVSSVEYLDRHVQRRPG
ncbi:MAG: alpha/beta fold hydrolase [Actinomycetota bacterium]